MTMRMESITWVGRVSDTNPPCTHVDVGPELQFTPRSLTVAGQRRETTVATRTKTVTVRGATTTTTLAGGIVELITVVCIQAHSININTHYT